MAAEEENDLYLVSIEHTLQRGLELVGFTPKQIDGVKRSKNLSRFRTHYNLNPVVYSILFRLLQTTDNENANILPFFKKVRKEKTFDCYLMAVHLLACYPKEEEAEGIFGISNVTWSNWVWSFVERINLLLPEVVEFPENWGNPDSDNNDEPYFVMTVDGIHCPIEEPTHDQCSENKKYFSHKFRKAALDYELDISIFSQQCAWVSGPYPAGTHDITVFRARLKKKIQEARERSRVPYRVIGDRGYRGEREFISTPSSHDSEALRDFKGRALSRHETFNGRLKNFDCLQERFRHSIKKHKWCFAACVVIVQIGIQNGAPLFEV